MQTRPNQTYQAIVAAPGLVYELMPKLWAVIQFEETDESTYPWTLNEADRPIVEAYLQAQLTYYTAITSNCSWCS